NVAVADRIAAQSERATAGSAGGQRDPACAGRPGSALHSELVVAGSAVWGESAKTTADAGESIGSISSPAQAPGRRDGNADNHAPEAALPAPGMPMDITGALPNASPAARSPAPQ